MRLIGLDLDGTLEDSRDDMVAAAARVRTRLGLRERADAQLRPHVNAGMRQLYRACFDDYLAGGDEAVRLAEVREAYETDYLANVAERTQLYPGIAHALVQLSQLGALACITNKPERISRRLLDALGVAARFAAVVGGDTCAESKPSPLMLQHAAQACGFTRGRGQAFMIGDTAADVRLGRAFGATTVWCAWGYSDAPGEAPDHRARAPEELAAIVASGDKRAPSIP